MIVLWGAGGASDFWKREPVFSENRWESFRFTAARLLDARSQGREASLLRSHPFELLHGDNHFGDEFTVLFAVVPFDDHLRFEERENDKFGQTPDFAAIVSRMQELTSQYVRFANPVSGRFGNHRPLQGPENTPSGPSIGRTSRRRDIWTKS